MKETWKYKLLSTIRYFGDGCFYPFFALYLVTTGLAEARIGFILSITPIIAIFANPLYARICKNVNVTKKVLAIVTVLEAVMITTIAFSNDFYLISGLVVLLALAGSCHYGLLDSLTAVYANNAQINYSSIRIYGSAAYIIATTFGGYIASLFGYRLCFIITSVLFILSGFCYYILRPITTSDTKTTIEKVSYRHILKNKTFILYAIFYILLLGSHFGTGYFLPTYFESRGVTTVQYGLVYSYFVFFEVVTIIILNRFFKKINVDALLIVSAVCVFIMVLCNYLYLPIPVVIGITCLRGIGYGIILHVCYKYVVDLLGDNEATFAIMFLTLGQSIYIAIANNVNGNLIEHYSYKTFYFVSMIIALLIIALGVYRYFAGKREKKVNDYGL